MADAANAFLKDLNAEQRSKATLQVRRRLALRVPLHAARAHRAPDQGDDRGAARQGARAAQDRPQHARLHHRDRRSSISRTCCGRSSRRAPAPNAIVRDPEMYFVSIYGTPGKSPWGWKFEGHHVSTNFTIVDDKPVVFAPNFFGSNPARRPRRAEEGHARAARRRGGRPRADGRLQRGAARQGDLRRRRRRARCSPPRAAKRSRSTAPASPTAR